MNKQLLTIKYNNKVIEESDAAVLDISKCNIPELREFNAFRKYCLERMYLISDYSGVVSPKFTIKTGLKIEDALRYVDGSVDVVLFHPYPQELLLQSDFMQLAELEHPGITVRMGELWWSLFGEKMPVISLPDNIIYCCHCNYFVANQKFWKLYSPVISKIDTLYVNGGLDEFISENTKYSFNVGSDRKVSFFPFIFERLLTHFLYKYREDLTVRNVSLEAGYQSVNIFKNEDKLVSGLRYWLISKDMKFHVFKCMAVVRIYYVVRRSIFDMKHLFFGLKNVVNKY